MIGITGPVLGWSDPARSKFIIFYCAMISREVLDKVGFLDEDFKEGAGEDTDLCVRAMDAGYKLAEVPDKPKFKGGLFCGGFPIYHKGEATMNKLENWPELFHRNSKMLANKYKDRPIRLNLGCGPYLMEGYINIDLYNPDADINCDVRDLSRYEAGSVDVVYAGHLLEHFSPYKVMDLLREWVRVLKPKGRLVLELPDIEECCKHYATADKAKKYEILTCIYGQLPDVIVPHQYGWDLELLTDHLTWAGCENIVKLPQQVYHGGYNMRIECQKV